MKQATAVLIIVLIVGAISLYFVLNNTTSEAPQLQHAASLDKQPLKSKLDVGFPPLFPNAGQAYKK